MGITEFFRWKWRRSEAEKDVAQYYQIGEFTEEDCEGCTGCYPSSLSIDDGPLHNSAPKVHGQILVATGQTNWLKDVATEQTPWGHVCKALDSSSDKLKEIVGGPLRINATNQDFDDAVEAGKIAVTVLPHFIRILTDSEHCVADVIRVLKLQPGDELGENMISIRDRGFILLCSHRTRDKRCGITAPILKKALDIELRHEGLYRDPDDNETDGIRVIMCNHVGGHKFAANALIYQNNGMALMLARLGPQHAKALVHKTILNEIVVPDHVRFCTKLPAYSW